MKKLGIYIYPTVDDFNFVAPGFKEISGFPSSFVDSIAINSNFNWKNAHIILFIEMQIFIPSQNIFQQLG